MEEWWVMSFAFMKVNNDWHTKSLPGCDSWRRGVCPAWWASPTRRRAPPQACSPRGGRTRSVQPRGWPRMKYWTSCCQPNFNISGYWGKLIMFNVTSWYGSHWQFKKSRDALLPLTLSSDSCLIIHSPLMGRSGVQMRCLWAPGVAHH